MERWRLADILPISNTMLSRVCSCATYRLAMLDEMNNARQNHTPYFLNHYTFHPVSITTNKSSLKTPPRIFRLPHRIPSLI